MTKHFWHPKRKAELANKIIAGELTVKDVARLVGEDCSIEEVAEWVRRYNAGGQQALRVSTDQRHRKTSQ